MLTVKLIESNGHQQIHAVKVVSASPAEGPNAMRVAAWREDDTHLEFEGDGVVYVMNDAGQTVANYYLGHRPAEEVAAAA